MLDFWNLTSFYYVLYGVKFVALMLEFCLLFHVFCLFLAYALIILLKHVFVNYSSSSFYHGLYWSQVIYGSFLEEFSHRLDKGFNF